MDLKQLGAQAAPFSYVLELYVRVLFGLCSGPGSFQGIKGARKGPKMRKAIEKVPEGNLPNIIQALRALYERHIGRYAGGHAKHLFYGV